MNRTCTPDGAVGLGTSQIRVANAVARIHAEHGRVTINDLITDVGLNRSTVHTHLNNLRRLGIVTWDDGRHGTLRPAVQRVDV